MEALVTMLPVSMVTVCAEVWTLVGVVVRLAGVSGVDVTWVVVAAVDGVVMYGLNVRPHCMVKLAR